MNKNLYLLFHKIFILIHQIYTKIKIIKTLKNKNIMADIKLLLSLIVLILSIIIYLTYNIKSNPNYIPETIEKIKNIQSILSLSKTYDYDIIIVGSGLAGLSAAYEANDISNGSLKICILEQEPKYGGNSMKATSGINMLNSPLQKKENIKDSFDLFFNDTRKSGKYINDINLVSTLVNDSTDIYNYFTKQKADLSKLGILGGHSVKRTLRPTKFPVGFHLTSTTYKNIQNNPNIKIYLNTTVTDLIYSKKNNQVEGVYYYKSDNINKIKYIKSKTVILATGGFGHDFSDENSLLKKYVPRLMKFPTTNGPQTKGIGMKIAFKIGAYAVDMEQVQLHPTGFVDLNNRYDNHKILAPELIRGVGAILINQNGKRFCNELGPRDYVSQRIIKNCNLAHTDIIKQYEAFVILNQEGIDEYGGNILFYVNKGLLRKYTIENFCEEFKLNYTQVILTLEQYNKDCENKIDEFGKTVFPRKFNLSNYIYAGIVSPSIHYTMGGIKINKDGEIINVDGKVIKGLYGAGEVTGGVHGGNRLGGNSLLECAVFGRRCARSAYQFIKDLK